MKTLLDYLIANNRNFEFKDGKVILNVLFVKVTIENDKDAEKVLWTLKNEDMISIIMNAEYDPEDGDSEEIAAELLKKGYGNILNAIDRFVQYQHGRVNEIYDPTEIEMVAEEFKKKLLEEQANA